MWQKFGTGAKKRMIPLHNILRHLGESFCKVVLKAHVLTGDDTMSKVGTKKAAVQDGDPVSYLSQFAKHNQLTDNEISLT